MAIDVPFIATAQMRNVDRFMMGEFRISLLQMMECAWRPLACLARDRFLNGDCKGKRVAVLVGTGGNGGRGMVCAHNLHNWGATVELFGVLGTNDFDPIPALPLVSGAQDLPEADLIIDALVGYSLSGPPRGALASLIRSAADVECPTLALDVPMSEVYEPAVKADATLRLALSKTGLAVQGAQAYVGELWLADIGVPPELYAKPTVGVRVRMPFNENDLVKLSD